MKKYGFLIATAAVAGAMAADVTPARAQVPSPVPIRVKIGIMMPQNDATRDFAGSTFLNGEIEVAVPTLVAGQIRASAGYAEGRRGGRNLRIIPLTVSQVFSPPNPVGRVTGNPYFGLGAGAYLLRASGGGVSEERTTFGGFAVAGYDFPGVYFLEAKYHVAGRVADISPNGIAVLAGRRF